MKTVVFAVHPDDETLGAGGTLLRLKREGEDIYWCIATIFTRNDDPLRSKQIRQKTIEQVAKSYGFRDVFDLAFEAAKLESLAMDEILIKIKKVIDKVRPERIIVPFLYDSHSDHRIFFEALSTIFKSFRNPKLKEILMMETPSETNQSLFLSHQMFVPNYFVNISKEFSKKMKILNLYNAELGKHPFPRSLRGVEALGVYRGSFCEAEYAEAFQLVKKIF